MADSVTVILRYLLAVSGAVLGILAWMNVVAMKQDKEKVLSAFTNHPAAEIMDLKLLLRAEVVMAIGFLGFAIGGYYDKPVFLHATRITGIIFILILARVFYRRERRVTHGS